MELPTVFMTTLALLIALYLPFLRSLFLLMALSYSLVVFHVNLCDSLYLHFCTDGLGVKKSPNFCFPWNVFISPSRFGGQFNHLYDSSAIFFSFNTLLRSVYCLLASEVSASHLLGGPLYVKSHFVLAALPDSALLPLHPVFHII